MRAGHLRDSQTVEIGDRVIMGPNVQIYSGGHVTDPKLRNGAYGAEFGKTIKIGNDVWLGGACILLCVC
jgi:maltose O-acetyltransferase